MAKYRCYQDGELVGEKESRAKLSCAVIASAAEEIKVVSWAKDRATAERFIVGRRGKALAKAGAFLSVEDVEVALEPSPPTQEESSTPPADVKPPVVEIPADQPTPEALPPSGSDRIHKTITYKGARYKVEYVPDTRLTKVDNVIYGSPTAAAEAITGSHVNGRAFFGLGSSRPAGTCSRDPIAKTARAVAAAEARVQKQRLRLAALEAKLEKATTDLSAARAELEAAGESKDAASL